jgi:hypothetical protein
MPTDESGLSWLHGGSWWPRRWWFFCSGCSTRLTLRRPSPAVHSPVQGAWGIVRKSASGSRFAGKSLGEQKYS